MAVPGLRGPVVALTGTPGTGKTAVADRLRAHGLPVLDLKRYVGDPRFDRGADEARSGTVVLDEEALSDHLLDHLTDDLEVDAAHAGPVFIESHFAHELDIVDRILVLRCRPGVLAARLAPRGWSTEKVRENLEAEALDVIVQDAVAVREQAEAVGEEVVVGEIDTTEKDIETVMAEVLRLARAPPDRLRLGTVDWSDDVLGWY